MSSIPNEGKMRKVGSRVALAMVVFSSPYAAADPYAADYKRDTTKHINDVVLKGNKTLTRDEHVAINEHWHLATRALRVREVALGESEQASVARVDAFLKKKDAAFFAHLEELNAKAPVKIVLAPPKIGAPTEGQSMSLDGKLAFQIEPDTNATK